MGQISNKNSSMVLRYGRTCTVKWKRSVSSLFLTCDRLYITLTCDRLYTDTVSSLLLSSLIFSSSAYPQTGTAQLYNTHRDSCAHMDRTGLEFNLSLRNKNSSHCHLDIIQEEWSFYTKFQVHAWMIINSSRKNSNQLVNCQKFAHKLS